MFLTQRQAALHNDVLEGIQIMRLIAAVVIALLPSSHSRSCPCPSRLDLAFPTTD